MKNLRLLIVGTFLLIFKVNFAQDAAPVLASNNTTNTGTTTTPATATPAEGEEEKVNGTLTVSGYLDSYYFTNFNKPASRDNLGQSGVGRGFDRRVDQFGLGMVQTVFTYKNKKSEAVADLAFGPSAQYGNYGNVGGPTYGVEVFSALMIKQAYFKYNATDKWSFTMGQFGTHIGYEYIDAPLNFFYSINNTFNSGIPFYHTGLKSTYVFSDKVSLMAGVVNGFDFVYDNNKSKGIIGQLSLAPAKGFTMYLNFISSKEANANPATGKTPTGNFTVYDLNGGYQLSEKFFIGYWGMFGSQKGELGSPGTFVPADGDVDATKTWWGANLYLTYAATEKFSIGFRGERFDNKSGARGLRNIEQTGDTNNPTQAVGASANTYTLTGSWTLADGHLLLKPELRMDMFDKLSGSLNKNSQQFMDSEGNFSKNSQTTLGFAAIYKF